MQTGRGIWTEARTGQDSCPGYKNKQTSKQTKTGQEEKGVEGMGWLLPQEIGAGPSSERTCEQR